MEKNIDVLLDIFSNALKENKNALKENKYVMDNQKIMYMYSSLKDIQNKLSTLEEIEKLKEIEMDLEVKYEDFYEIGNYFDPLYIELRNIIHKNEVKRIREQNRNKREKNSISIFDDYIDKSILQEEINNKISN